jgi:hypothetical protein
MTFDDAQRLQALNVVASRDGAKEGAERTWAWERWDGTCEPREASLLRASEARHRWQLDQLAVVRDEGKVRVAYVTRVSLGADDGLSVSLRLWSSVPKALALRRDDSTGGPNTGAAACRDSGRQSVPGYAALVQPGHVLSRSRRPRRTRFRLTRRCKGRRFQRRVRRDG